MSIMSERNNGLFGYTGNALSAALTYGILFVPIMLLLNKELTADSLGLPALAIYLVVKLIEYIARRSGVEEIPQWIVIGSFALSIIGAVLMGIIL